MPKNKNPQTYRGFLFAVRNKLFLVGAGRIELPTSTVSMWRSPTELRACVGPGNRHQRIGVMLPPAALEAPTGIEPVNGGFADLCPYRLATAPHPARKKNGITRLGGCQRKSERMLAPAHPPLPLLEVASATLNHEHERPRRTHG